ncbi:hypothetical protein F2Q69_00048872 [Brassica cretica]|uniref:Uncharacterized protein n=1 Tax=Brassica cretica TaxID=69181 RepID=A0A8S9Q6C8_BRACR|nr:hypothetical protein F2Q69_00048872 [Brassica cretica]
MMKICWRTTTPSSHPPGPPDPSSPLSPQNFPTLSEAKTTPKPSSNYRFGTVTRSTTVPSTASKGSKSSTAGAFQVPAAVSTAPYVCEVADTSPMSTGSVKSTIQGPNLEESTRKSFSIITFKPSSPIQTNKASCSQSLVTDPNPTIQLESNQTPSQNHLNHATVPFQTQAAPPTLVE